MKSQILFELLSIRLDATDVKSPHESRALRKLFQRGARLRGRQADSLEKHLKLNGGDIAIRLALLGYYKARRGLSAQYGEPYFRHISWFIQNEPTSFAAKSSYHVDNMYYRRLKRKWLKQIRSNPDDVVLLDQAASFCYLLSDTLSERFWKRAQQLEPENAMWPYNLARLYKTSIQPDTTERRKRLLAKKALQEWRKVLALPSGYPEKTYLTPYLIAETNADFELLSKVYERM